MNMGRGDLIHTRETNMYSSKNVFVSATLGLLMATGIGCGPEQNNATTEQTSCNKVSVEGEDYCVVKQEIIIETGYTCPATFMYRYEVSALTVCSNRATPPTRPIIFELWRLAYGQEPPPETDMGMVDMPGSDMGGGDMGEEADFGLFLSCEAITESYQLAVDNDLDRSCQQDTDCAVIQGDCHMSEAGERCTLAAKVGADTSALKGWVDYYDERSCRANQANCQACEAATAICNQGMCEAQPVAARTCEDIKTDYAVIHDSLPTACQQDADCEYTRATACGVTGSVSEACKAVTAGSDLSSRAALGNEYQALGCGVNDPVCNICEEEPVKCDQGVCIVVPDVARSCEDIEADYAAQYAALPQTCQAAADCQSAGVNACGVSSEVVGGCGIAVSTSADFSALGVLGQEHQMLGCDQGPECAACPSMPVDCVNGMCVSTM